MNFDPNTQWANSGAGVPEEYKRNELFIPYPRCYFCCLIPLCRLVDKIEF